MLLPSVFLFILVCCPYSTSTSTKTAKLVDTAVKALQNAVEMNDGGLFDLSLLGKQVPTLMKAFVSIGSLVTEKTKEGKLDSQSKALIDFKNRTEKLWEVIQTRIYIGRTAIKSYKTTLEFAEKLDIFARKTSNRAEKFIHPNGERSKEFIDNFKKFCRFDIKSAQSILNYLNLRLVENCNDRMTPTQVKEFVDYRDAFMMASRRLQVEKKKTLDPEIYLTELFATFEKHDKEVLNGKLDVFSRSFTSNEEAIPAFFKELNGRASIKVKNNETSCLLRAMAYSTFFNNEYAEAFGFWLKNQLIDLTYTAGICANVVFDGNAESIDSLNKEIVDTVTRISSHSAKLFNESLIASWPSAHNQILKEEIMSIASEPGNVPSRIMEMVASIVGERLTKTGLPNHLYKLFITKAVEPEYELYFEGIYNQCSLNKGAFGFDTVIGRIHRDSASQTDYGNHRSFGLIDDYREVKNKIWSEMNAVSDLPTLSLIAEKLKTKIGKEFITESKFHCWAIVREYASILYGPLPAVNSWTTYYDYVDLNCIRTLTYTSTTHDGDKFQFVFFA